MDLPPATLIYVRVLFLDRNHPLGLTHNQAEGSIKRMVEYVLPGTKDEWRSL